MLRRYWIWGTVLTISGWLVVGCGSASTQRSAAKSRPNPAVVARSPAPSGSSEWPADKIAQAHAHYAAGVIHEMNEEPEAALNEYYQAALNDPDNETLILDVSRRFIHSKQPEKALEILSQAASRPQASGAVFARLGMVYAQLGKTEQAVAASRTAIKRSPESLAGYQNLLLTFLQNKQEPEAWKALEEANRRPNPGAEFLVGLSELYAQYALQVPAQKDKAQAKALVVLNRADKLSPTNAVLRLRLADGFNLLGENAKAARLYLELLNQLPDVPMVQERVHAKLAEIYLRDSDQKKAAEQLQAIVKADPTNPLAYYYLGSLSYEQKKPAEAADYFTKTVLLRPEFEQAYYDLALAQISLSQTNEALATLDKARGKFPQNFVCELLTGMVYSRQKAYPEAIQHYTAAEVIAKATDPKRLNQAFYFQLGAAYERVADYAQAEKYFEKCLQLDPDFHEAMNYLGYMWAEHGARLDQARALIEKAIKADPKNAAYLDSYAWVLFKLNQTKEALTYVLKAIECSEEPDATVYDHLGDIYSALKQRDKAREAWTKSLALEPNDQVRRKLTAAGEK